MKDLDTKQNFSTKIIFFNEIIPIIIDMLAWVAPSQ